MFEISQSGQACEITIVDGIVNRCLFRIGKRIGIATSKKGNVLCYGVRKVKINTPIVAQG